MRLWAMQFLVLLTMSCAKAPAVEAPVPAMPSNWVVEAQHQVSDRSQLAAFSEKLGGTLVAVANVHYDVDGLPVQLNIAVAKDEASAEAVASSLSQVKSRAAIFRDGVVNYEFVYEEEALDVMKSGMAHLRSVVVADRQ